MTTGVSAPAGRWWERARDDVRVRTIGLTAYYLGVLIALAALYGTGSVEAPAFVYQGF